jgi:Ca2+-dependent lipid-binding protein
MCKRSTTATKDEAQRQQAYHNRAIRSTTMGVLTVYLDKITSLRDGDGVGKSDPYVKFHLEQDNILFDKNFGKQTSTKKKNDLNPEFGETFTFDDVPSVDNLVLHVKIMDDDWGKDDKIGACKINLEKAGLSADPKEFEDTIDKNGGWFSKNAKIYLKISFAE